jgi:hypothetical protein
LRDKDNLWSILIKFNHLNIYNKIVISNLLKIKIHPICKFINFINILEHKIYYKIVTKNCQIDTKFSSGSTPQDSL